MKNTTFLSASPAQIHKTSIKPMLNISKTASGRLSTLIIQLIRERKRGVIFTPYRLSPEEFSVKKHRVIPSSGYKGQRERAKEINIFLDKQVEELKRIIREFEREKTPFSVRDIILAYRQRYDNRYVHTFFLTLIEELKRSGSQGTAVNYHSTLTAFEKFSGTRSFHFDQVNEVMLMDFERFLRQMPLQPNTIAFYMSNFRAVYNKARKRGYAKCGTSPFNAVSIHIEKTRKLAVSAEVIRKVANADFSDSEKLTMARDLFMFSFYTRGMSFADMAYLRQKDICNGTIHYRRRKTGQVFAVKIVPEAQEILDRYRKPCSPWALPVMLEYDERHKFLRPLVYQGSTPEERLLFDEKVYRRYKYNLSHYLRFYSDISKRLDLPVRLSFNVARHSWASLARNEGIPISVISIGLGHTSEKTTQIYLDELDNRKIDDANETVIQLLRNMNKKANDKNGKTGKAR